MKSVKRNEDRIRVTLAVVVLGFFLAGATVRGQEKANVTVRVKVVDVPRLSDLLAA